MLIDIELAGVVTPLIYELGKDFIAEKILPNRKEAKLQMQSVLFELKQIYQTFENEFAKFKLLNFSNQNIFYYSQRDLNAILREDYKDKFDEARGHCHKILAIYNDCLKRWFFDLLSSEKAEKLDSLFSKMSFFDEQMLIEMESFINWIQPQADKIQKLILEKKYQFAEESIKIACDKFTPSMDRIRNLLKDISNLENAWR